MMSSPFVAIGNATQRYVDSDKLAGGGEHGGKLKSDLRT